MARSGWGEGPIDIGGGGIRIPPFPRPNPGALRAILLAAAVGLMLFTGYYQVEPDEVAVVQRFGAYARTTDPGPHLKIPFGLETVTKVPVQRQLKMEFGFRTLRAATRTEYAPDSAETAGESVMLTGDLNVAVVEWIVQFRIKDARQYLFHVRDVPETFRYMSEAAMRLVVGDHSVDEVLTIGREEVALRAKEELQRLCDLYGIGIEVQQLVLQNVNPPNPVKPAFNEVNQAIQEKERAINDAWAEYNKAVPKAKGEAEQAVRAAEGYALERVNNAEGDAKRFDALFDEYRKAPAVTRKRMYLESMSQLMPKLGKKLVLDDKAKGILPLLQLGGDAKEVGEVKRPWLVPAALFALFLVGSAVYTVGETEQAILVQFGRPVGGLVKTPGLHLKLPFIQVVHRFDKRWLEYDGDATEIPTRDKKYIWVDTYARWRISDPLRFYQAVRDERGAQSRLDDIVDGETRNAVASFDLIEVVRSSNRPFQLTEELEGIGAAEAMAKISAGRSKIAQVILDKAAKVTPEFGIELVDVRFKRINYVETVQQKVFERMISERKRIAERSRSEGQGRAAEIRGQKERDVLAASSAGYKSAQELKGAADGKATAIYARAYNKDPEFYQFWKTMETLDTSLDAKTWLILTTDSELFKYLKSPGGS